MYGQHRKIKSQNVKPLELKDSKEAGKWQSEKTKEKTVLLFHRRRNLFNHHHPITDDAETPVFLMLFFNLGLQFKKADVISLLAPLTKD